MSKKSSRTKPSIRRVTCQAGNLAGARHSLDASIDTRAARSRAALQDAFLSLIMAKSYEAISIKDICAAAGCSRSTFYAHFPGKDDLARSGVRLMRLHFADCGANEASASRGKPFAFSLALFEHARGHLDLYRALIGGRGGVVKLAALREMLRGLVAADIRIRELHAKGSERSLAVQYYVGALIAVLTWWLDSGAKLPAQQVDAIFRRLTNCDAR